MTPSASICALAIAMTATVSTTPRPAAGDGLLLVANKGDRTLGIIDTAAGQQVAAVPENGVTGHEVIASPDGKTAYVPIYGDSGVNVDVLTRALTISTTDVTIAAPASSTQPVITSFRKTVPSSTAITGLTYAYVLTSSVGATVSSQT